MWTDDEDEQDDEDIIPGDNDKDIADGAFPQVPGSVPNLTHIPAIGGDIPIVVEPEKPQAS